MNEREVFLQALAENEDDVRTRLVYADWLDELGEHEEADRQRKWPAAKEWLIQFCRAHNPPPDELSEIRAIEYERLLELGREAIEAILDSRNKLAQFDSIENMLHLGWQTLEVSRLIDSVDDWTFHFGFGNNFDMCYGLADNIRPFWQNWSIVTGIPLPPGIEDKSRFHCSC